MGITSSPIYSNKHGDNLKRALAHAFHYRLFILDYQDDRQWITLSCHPNQFCQGRVDR